MARTRKHPQKLRELAPSLKRIRRHFWPYLRRHRALMGGSLVALFMQVGLRLLEPWPLAIVVDHVLAPPESGPPPLPVIGSLGLSTLLALAAAGVVLIVGLRALAVYSSMIAFALVGNRVLTRVRADLYRHLHRLSLSFHTRARNGDLTVRVISDVGLLQEVVVTAVLPLLGNILILISMFSLLLWLHWQLALLTLVTVPLFWLSTLRLSRRIHHASRDQRKREGAMASTTAESIGAIKIVQALSLEDVFAQYFSSQNQASLKEGVKGKRLAATLERTVDLLVAVSTALVLYFGAWFVLDGELTAGELLVFLAYLKTALKPVRDFTRYTGRMAKAAAAGERVLDIFNRESEIRNRPDAVTAPHFRGEVRFENVSFGYEPGRRVLAGIGFVVNPGEHVGVVSASGNGKSTLVNLILRLYDPDEGRVVIDGRDIREYTIESLRSQIGVVLQDSILFHASVRDNIAYGAPGAPPEEVEDAARLANAHEFIEALPKGYDTVLGERGVTLSGGQRQRIAVARAAIRKSTILILDEPTTGLDEKNEREVIEALERLTRDHTAFLVTHNLHLTRRADRIFYVEHGRVVEWGTHEEMMQIGGRYAAMYKLQEASRLRATNEEESRAFTS